MTDCVIFDIDGTLANLDHRLHYVQGRHKDWDAFFAEMDKDSVYEETRDFLYAICDWNLNPVFFTARPEDYREETLEWVRHKLMDNIWFPLYMRPSGDHRRDSVVKAEMLERAKADGWNPLFAVDDRQQVIDVWVAAGLPVFKHIAPNTRPEVAERTKTHWDTPLLHLMVGPTGAGKSTYLEGIGATRDVVSSDQMRQHICGDWRDQTQNDLVFEALHQLVKTRVMYGLETWVDATNIRRKDRRAIVELVPHNVQVEYVILNRPILVKVRDADWRPEWLLEKHEHTFNSNLRDILDGDGFPNVTVTDLRR